MALEPLASVEPEMMMFLPGAALLRTERALPLMPAEAAPDEDSPVLPAQAAEGEARRAHLVEPTMKINWPTRRRTIPASHRLKRRRR